MNSTGARILKRAVLAISCFCSAIGLAAQSGGQPPLVMPQVNVAASAPLIKTAEFQMRHERVGPAAVVHGGYIYIIGGGDSRYAVLDSIERFDLRTGQSEEFARLKTARLWHRAVLAGNRIYVLGGRSVELVSQAPASGPEASGAATRTQRLAMDRMGWSGERLGFETTVEVVDLATKKITRAADLPDGRAEFACVLRGEKIFVIGGNVDRGTVRGATNTTIIFDLATGKWSNGPLMPTPRSSEGVLVDGGFIIVPGGYDGQRSHTEVEVFNPAINSWRTLPPLCAPTSAHSLVFLDHYLFLFGNYDRPGDLIAYDLVTKTSDSFTLQYTPSRHTAAVVHDGKIYVIGGRPNRETDALTTIQVFELRKKK